MENGVEDVRILVAANPSERIELKCASADISQERRCLKGPNVERNADLPQLLLQNRREQAR